VVETGNIITSLSKIVAAQAYYTASQSSP
jgi:hypothetical protein